MLRLLNMRASLLILLLLSLGCGDSRTEPREQSTTTSRQVAVGSGEQIAVAPLQQQIETRLQAIFARRLNTRDHGAWQIVHGCIPFRETLLIEHAEREIPALEFLLSGGEVAGWEWEPGVKLAGNGGRRGLRAPVRPGSATAQGHADQWLGYLASCELPLETPLVVRGEQFTLGDALAQLEYDVPHNVEREYSWTLMALARYRPHDHTWTAADGQTWSVAKLVEIELEQDLFDSPCAGAHRMVGMALAYQRWRKEQGERTTVWELLEKRLQKTVADVQAFQSAEGALSSDSFQRPFQSADVGQQIAAGGHVLEFLAVHLTDEELAEKWVTRAVLAQCRLLKATEKQGVHCGALYHAASALRLYYERRYGEIRFTSQTSSTNAIEKPTP